MEGSDALDGAAAVVDCPMDALLSGLHKLLAVGVF